MSSKIEWTDETWNPTTGCTKVSEGCRHCYAERMAHRLQSMGLPQYRDGFALRLAEDALEKPLHWRKPRRVFVNSMSDLFHRDVPDEYLDLVMSVMHRASHHQYQVLTKRVGRMAAYSRRVLADGSRVIPDNVWMGASCEDQQTLNERLPLLRGVVCRTRFLSLEPLLGPISLPDDAATYIHWVIVGGESGPGARPMAAWWVQALRDQCIKLRIPFFFKQWGGINKSKTGRQLDGRTWDQMPNV